MFAADAFQFSLGVTTLLLLALALGLHFYCFYRWKADRRLFLPFLAVALLGPASWACSQMLGLGFARTAVSLSLRFALILSALELMLVPLTRYGGRVGGAVSVGTHLFLAGLTLLYVGLLAGLPLEDPYLRHGLGTCFLLYLTLHMGYSYLFKRPTHGLWHLLQRRLRGIAYLLVPALAGWYGLAYWSLLPLTGSMLTDYQIGVYCLLGVLCGEALLAMVFDYYFPVVLHSRTAHLTRDVSRALLYLSLGASLYHFMLHRDFGALIAASAYFSVGIGLALKPTLGNFVAGLVLRLSEPYVLGHWISVGGITGKVLRITWRSTDVQTMEGDLISLPNSRLSRQLIVNHSLPLGDHAVYHQFQLPDDIPPGKVREAALRALSRVSGVLPHPAAEVFMMDFSDWNVEYRLRFFIDDYSQALSYDSKVAQSLYYELTRLAVGLPAARLVSLKLREEGSDLLSEIAQLLSKVDFLAALAPEEQELLLRQARLQLFAAGETICQQGQPGNSFYIIKSGHLQVKAANQAGETLFSASLESGQFFGEMALLTGEPRSATVTAQTDSQLLRIHKEDLRAVLQANPQAQEQISRVVAERQLKLQEARAQDAERQAQSGAQTGEHPRLEQLSQQLLKSIRSFFSL